LSEVGDDLDLDEEILEESMDDFDEDSYLERGNRLG
jgi:hypothetical protein